MKWITTTLGICLLVSATMAHAGSTDPNLARNLAATCANCHGTNGKAKPGAGMDALAGMDGAKLLQKLKEFRSGSKPGTVMPQISKGYTEEQLSLVAAYFAAVK